MLQQELKDKASEWIEEPPMIDSVVNSIDNPTITNQSIFLPRNPSTKRVEFTTQDFVQDKNNTMEWNAAKDALYLYRSVLSGYTDPHPVSLAIRYLMDSKNFVKEWHFEEHDDFEEHDMHPLMALSCQFLPSFDELETELTRPLSPYVVVNVPRSSTIGELKIVVQSAFSDAYCVMDNLVVSQIGGLKRIEETKVVSHSIESSDPVWVRGFWLDLGTLLRYEDGARKLTVDCCCGTKYDDGERLAA